MLAFLSPEGCAPEVALVSPLARALAGVDPAAVEDLSAVGKVELRGDVDALELEVGEELVRLTPERALVLSTATVAGLLERARALGIRAYDVTAALAGIAVEGERLLRRLTELDLDALPAAGAIARGTPAVLLRDEGERFRIFVPQELGHYVVEVVLDLQRGLA